MLTDLLDNPPAVHHDAAGSPICWGLPHAVLRFLEGAVNDRSRTLETGAGLSTIVIANSGASHVVVVPDGRQVDGIRAYCREHDIALDRVTFHLGRSETVLPALTLGELDLVLIDGRHGFPTPFVDWYYTAAALKIGGLMVIDDTHLWTGGVLRDFLAMEDEWKLERELGKTAVFVKLRAGSHDKEWTGQPFVVQHSRPPA